MGRKKPPFCTFFKKFFIFFRKMGSLARPNILLYNRGQLCASGNMGDWDDENLSDDTLGNLRMGMLFF